MAGGCTQTVSTNFTADNVHDMTRIYISYALTLISAFAIYWMFGVMSSVAAGFTWVPFSSFLASVIQFGIGSWLFLHFPRTGKILATVFTSIICIWPLVVLSGLFTEFDVLALVIFLTPVLLCAVIIYNHIKTFKQPQRPPVWTRVMLSIIPFGLFVGYIFHIIRMINTGQISLGK